MFTCCSTPLFSGVNLLAWCPRFWVLVLCAAFPVFALSGSSMSNVKVFLSFPLVGDAPEYLVNPILSSWHTLSQHYCQMQFSDSAGLVINNNSCGKQNLSSLGKQRAGAPWMCKSLVAVNTASQWVGGEFHDHHPYSSLPNKLNSHQEFKIMSAVEGPFSVIEEPVPKFFICLYNIETV